MLFRCILCADLSGPEGGGLRSRRRRWRRRWSHAAGHEVGISSHNATLNLCVCVCMRNSYVRALRIFAGNSVAPGEETTTSLRPQAFIGIDEFRIAQDFEFFIHRAIFAENRWMRGDKLFRRYIWREILYKSTVYVYFLF